MAPNIEGIRMGILNKKNSYSVVLSLFIFAFLGCGGGGGGNDDDGNGTDSTPPVITVIGDNPTSVIVGFSYTDAGATAVDDTDGNIAVVTSGTVSTDTIGSYTLTYTATDSAGNTATATRTVNVISNRVANESCTPPEPTPGEPGDVSIEASFANLPALASPLAMVQPSSDSSFWLVALRAGQIVRFDNDPQVSSFTTVLDISGQVSTTFEMGLTGLAIHPNYPQDNRVFVVYNNSNQQRRSTVSSFTINTGTQVIDMNSEQELLTLEQPANNHNGGDIAFGMDGYLYVGFGDGGADFNESQDLTNLLGAMIRIDVSSVPYSIPADNPFNQGQSLCQTGERAQGDNTNCPEIYAYGFRNPWRWSFDSLTGELWLADVGESTFEEVDRVISGGNYGWPIMEGDSCFNGANCDTTGLELPVTQYPRSVGVSTVGGYVYRGDDSPSLIGQYIWGDTFSSQFLSVPADAQVGASFTEIFNSNRLIAGMAQGNDGEVYLLNLDGGAGDGIYRVVASGGTGGEVEMPTNLSDVGCFDTAQKTSSPGVVDYQIHSTLWSDGAIKQRAFAIPDNQVVEVTDDGDFLFPTDSILIKHFLNGDTFLETRLLINHASGWVGYSYEWNDAQTDAVLLADGKTEDVGEFIHTFPSSSECNVCHTNAANVSLGLEARQLNLVNPDLAMNQLTYLSDTGYLSRPLNANDEPRLYAIDDNTATLEQRARSYLHSNCSGCHRPGAASDFIDLRESTTLSQMNICNVEPGAGDLGVDGALLMTPGNADLSVLHLRMQTLGENRMPPLASLIEDQQATAVIAGWINSLTSCD